jgi:hypothetical protein
MPDNKSYNGRRLIYIVQFTDMWRLAGFVFSVFLVRDANRFSYSVQNNAEFKVLKQSREIDFVNPPLGGAWTQVHLISAIKATEERPPLTVFREGIDTMMGPKDCKAYTDHQP